MSKLTGLKVNGFVERVEELEARAEAYYNALKAEGKYKAASVFARIHCDLSRFLFDVNDGEAFQELPQL